MLDGLEYVHSKGIIHRDLKCENIVIAQNTLKIIDFATYKHRNTNDSITHSTPQDTLQDTLTHSKHSKQDKSLRRTFEYYVGTPNFMDPEAISNADSGFKRDFWSLGCLMYQVLVGRPPFYGSTEYFIIDRVRKFDLSFPPSINPDAKDLILSLLRDPEDRLGFDQIRAHPFLTSNKPKNLLGEFKSIRETCCKIGKLLLELENTREPEPSQEFTNKFNTHINTIRNEFTDTEECNSNCVLERVIELMYWMLEETKREITKEIAEANKYLS